MSQSESIAKLAAALAKAQPKIGAATKDKENPFFKSKYADLASVSDAVSKGLADSGLSYVQVSHDKPDAACIETIIIHDSGEWLGCGPVSVPVSKKDAQGFGSAMTYGRRYSLSAAFGVIAEDDDGNAAAKAPPSGSAAEVMHDQFKAMPDDEKDFLVKIAKQVKATLALGDNEAAAEYLEGQKLDSDEKLAIWSLFDSKERSAIKRAAKGV